MLVLRSSNSSLRGQGVAIELDTQMGHAARGAREPTLASSSLAAWIQMPISEGSARRASLRIFRALS